MIKIVENFITLEEETELLSHIRPSVVTSGGGRNSIKRYGSKLPYNAPVISSTIPKWLETVCFRVAFEEWPTIESVPEKVPNSVTINEYHTKQAIDWHIDSENSGPIISVLSLLTDAEMGFVYMEADGPKNVRYNLPRLSLVSINKDERWKWKHCLYPVESPRFSIVFRRGMEPRRYMGEGFV